MPVDQRIIETDVQSLGAERVDVFAHEVAPGGRVGAFIIGVLAVEHAEAFVMLRRQHGVFHTGRLRLARPFARVEEIGIEIFEILIVLFFRRFFAVFYPFMPRGHGVQPPMNEHAEAVMPEPHGIARRFSHNVAAHKNSLLLMTESIKPSIMDARDSVNGHPDRIMEKTS